MAVLFLTKGRYPRLGDHLPRLTRLTPKKGVRAGPFGLPRMLRKDEPAGTPVVHRLTPKKRATTAALAGRVWQPVPYLFIKLAGKAPGAPGAPTDESDGSRRSPSPVFGN
jgi:hypothetical protein